MQVAAMLVKNAPRPHSPLPLLWMTSFVAKYSGHFRKASSVIQLPLPLQLGAKSSEVLKSLGPPTLKSDERLIYLHEHEVGGTSADDRSLSSNIVVVYLRNGIVRAIQISETTSD